MRPDTAENSTKTSEVMRGAAAILAGVAVLAVGGVLIRIAQTSMRPSHRVLHKSPLTHGLPAPDSARLLEARGERGRALLRYSVPESAWSVQRFYRMAMLREGWKERPLPEENFGADVLAFSRAGRLCIITLSGGRAGAETNVNVLLQLIRKPDLRVPPSRDTMQERKDS